MRWLPLLLTGCLVDRDLYVERQRAICHPEAGCTDRPWWPDLDGDGWGDPSGAYLLAPRQPDLQHVNNRLDCDDGDAAITAELGVLCPAGFGAATGIAGGTADADLGAGPEPVEWVVVDADPGFLLHEAVDRCTLGWGGVLGGPRFAVETSPVPVWVADDAIDASWNTTVDGPTVWSGTALEPATLGTTAGVVCMRPTPDPADWETFEVPP
ncbi:MAG: hypothetical protein H6737_06415 [Alphaproteobacteria bacterium]|nr:hypothetical protein [Alphaproteobacteria bacterium]